MAIKFHKPKGFDMDDFESFIDAEMEKMGKVPGHKARQGAVIHDGLAIPDPVDNPLDTEDRRERETARVDFHDSARTFHWDHHYGADL